MMSEPGFSPLSALVRIQAREAAGFVSCGGGAPLARQGRSLLRDANGLTPNQRTVLTRLRSCGSQGTGSYSRIAGATGCNPTSVADIVTALRRRGLVRFERARHAYVAVQP